MTKTNLILVSLFSFYAATGLAQAEDQQNWNQFRGPTGDGRTAATNLPVEFSETHNIRWKIPILGVGWSSPVAWENQVWLTSGREGGQELFAICIDAESGKIVHHIKVFDVADPSMEWSNQNPHACPTPYVEEGRVFVHFGSYGTACIDTASGEIVWKRQDLVCNHRVGPASSPIVSGDSLYLQFDGVDVQYVAALNKTTGDTLWTKNREATSNLTTLLRDRGLSADDVAKTLSQKPGDNRKAYATPTLIELDGRRQLISPGAEVLFSYDPETGDELWRVEYAGWAWNVACRPVFANDMLYATNGLGQSMFGIRPHGTGNVTQTHVAWSTRKSAPNYSSPIVIDHLLFMISDQGGIASCLNAKTGEEVWRNRLGGSGEHWASPVYAGGNIYFSSKRGDVTVIAAKPGFEKVANSRLDASFIASPAVVGDSLILRSTTHLYCFANGFERTAAQVAADKRRDEAMYEDATKSTRAEESNLVDLDALKKRLTLDVRGGKMTAEAAEAQYRRIAQRQQGGGRTKSAADWEAAYQQLLKTNAGLREKVENGGATKEQVIAWMKNQSAAGAKGKAGNKGKNRPKAGGPTNFYAIVIGRLKTKDVELGEFTMEVDHVTSMYGARWVKDEIVGKTVKVTGVSGQFRDQLLLLKRGETLKVRTGRYKPEGDEHVLTFGFKFHVLERALPFNPDDYGVPPKAFRGFQGELQGTIVEIGGYEITLRVEDVVKTADGSTAADADSIKGKLVRLTGFYPTHEELFKNLHSGDTIRVGATHADPTFDEFRVTDELEKIGQQ